MLPERILPVYRDEEAVILDLIDAYFTGLGIDINSGDQTPEGGFDRGVPFVRVGRTGGAPIRGSEHTDRPVIDIDVLFNDRHISKGIAKQIEQLLMSRPHPLDDCNVLMSPQRVPWVEGSGVIRFYSSYQVSLRR